MNPSRHHKVRRGSQQVVGGRDQWPGAANRAFEILFAMMFRAEEWGMRNSCRSMSATLGTLQWNDMQVADGRFMGSTAANSNNYDAVGQFGGANQAGIVGHSTGSDFRSVFYGNKD